jgi:hypothetical protein
MCARVECSPGKGNATSSTPCCSRCPPRWAMLLREAECQRHRASAAPPLCRSPSLSGARAAPQVAVQEMVMQCNPSLFCRIAIYYHGAARARRSAGHFRGWCLTRGNVETAARAFGCGATRCFQAEAAAPPWFACTAEAAYTRPSVYLLSRPRGISQAAQSSSARCGCSSLRGLRGRADTTHGQKHEIMRSWPFSPRLCALVYKAMHISSSYNFHGLVVHHQHTHFPQWRGPTLRTGP